MWRADAEAIPRWRRAALPFALAMAAASGCGGKAISAMGPTCADAAAAPASLATICTDFVRDRAFDAYLASASGEMRVWGVAGTGPADVYVALFNFLQGRLGRWDGAAWATETLPESAFAVSAPVTDASGEPWAVMAELGDSRSGGNGPSALIHRRGGAWVLEPKPPFRALGALGGTSSGLFVATVDETTGIAGLWRWQTGAWRPSPIKLSDADGASKGRLGISGFWGGACGEALAFAQGERTDALFSTLLRLEGDHWASVAVPPLSDITSVSGPTIDDLYVLALNRNQDQAARVFHVTNGLRTWTPLTTPPNVDYAAVWSGGPGLAVAVGCEWSDRTKPAPADCGRVTTFSGDTSATTSLVGVTGTPTTLWREPQPQTGAFHLFTVSPDANGLLRSQHFVAPAECPPPP